MSSSASSRRHSGTTRFSMKFSRAPAITSYLAALVVVMISSGTPNAAQISARENLRFSRNCRSLLASFGVTTSAPPHSSTGLIRDPGPALALPQRRQDLLPLLRIQLLGRADNGPGIAVVLHDALHEQGRRVIRARPQWPPPPAATCPRQKSNGLGSFSCHTSSGRNTWLESGLLRL